MNTARARAAAPWLVFVGVFVAALSMRSPIVAPTPVMPLITDAYGLDSGVAGLITTAPILMFALITPVAAVLIRKRGPEIAVMVTLVGVLIGSLLRTLPGFGWMLTGMLVIGAAITIGNVVMPVIIRRDAAPERVAFMTASYTAMLNTGSLITSLCTAPLAQQIGWNAALLVWSALTVAGIGVWAIHMRRHRRALAADTQAVETERDVVAALTGPTPVVGAPATGLAVLKNPLTIMLMLSFGMQSGSYYALTTWLPTIGSEELGMTANEAGAIASLFQGVAIVGALLVPVLMRFLPVPVAVGFIGLCWITVTLGLAVAPQFITVWMIVGALAQAGGFVAIFTLMVGASRSAGEAASMSAAVQGGGYLISATGAPVTGFLHDITGSWDASLWALVGATVLFAILLVSASLTGRRHSN